MDSEYPVGIFKHFLLSIYSVKYIIQKRRVWGKIGGFHQVLNPINNTHISLDINDILWKVPLMT